MIARYWQGKVPSVRRRLTRAGYYPEDKEFLLEFEPIVTHYDVLEHLQPKY